jgi:hypothetical protein
MAPWDEIAGTALVWSGMKPLEMRGINIAVEHWLHLRRRLRRPVHRGEERRRSPKRLLPDKELGMNAKDERTRSLWMSVTVAPGAPLLSFDVQCDTVIIGSGIAATLVGSRRLPRKLRSERRGRPIPESHPSVSDRESTRCRSRMATCAQPFNRWLEDRRATCTIKPVPQSLVG